MRPRDSKNLTETNKNIYSRGKDKERVKIFRASFNASFGNLSLEIIDASIVVVR